MAICTCPNRDMTDKRCPEHGDLAIGAEYLANAAVGASIQGPGWNIGPGMVQNSPSGFAMQFEIQEASEQAIRVLEQAKSALDAFLEKNRGYGADNAGVLGARGQYADIWRKVGKLKHTLWEGNPAVGEPIEEMLKDLIGHCLLTLDFLEQENK